MHKVSEDKSENNINTRSSRSKSNLKEKTDSGSLSSVFNAIMKDSSKTSSNPTSSISNLTNNKKPKDITTNVHTNAKNKTASPSSSSEDENYEDSSPQSPSQIEIEISSDEILEEDDIPIILNEEKSKEVTPQHNSSHVPPKGNNSSSPLSNPHWKQTFFTKNQKKPNTITTIIENSEKRASLRGAKFNTPLSSATSPSPLKSLSFNDKTQSSKQISNDTSLKNNNSLNNKHNNVPSNNSFLKNQIYENNTTPSKIQKINDVNSIYHHKLKEVSKLPNYRMNNIQQKEILSNNNLNQNNHKSLLTNVYFTKNNNNIKSSTRMEENSFFDEVDDTDIDNLFNHLNTNSTQSNLQEEIDKISNDFKICQSQNNFSDKTLSSRNSNKNDSIVEIDAAIDSLSQDDSINIKKSQNKHTRNSYEARKALTDRSHNRSKSSDFIHNLTSKTDVNNYSTNSDYKTTDKTYPSHHSLINLNATPTHSNTSRTSQSLNTIRPNQLATDSPSKSDHSYPRGSEIGRLNTSSHLQDSSNTHHGKYQPRSHNRLNFDDRDLRNIDHNYDHESKKVINYSIRPMINKIDQKRSSNEDLENYQSRSRLRSSSDESEFPNIDRPDVHKYKNGTQSDQNFLNRKYDQFSTTYHKNNFYDQKNTQFSSDFTNNLMESNTLILKNTKRWMKSKYLLTKYNNLIEQYKSFVQKKIKSDIAIEKLNNHINNNTVPKSLKVSNELHLPEECSENHIKDFKTLKNSFEIASLEIIIAARLESNMKLEKLTDDPLSFLNHNLDIPLSINRLIDPIDLQELKKDFTFECNQLKIKIIDDHIEDNKRKLIKLKNREKVESEIDSMPTKDVIKILVGKEISNQLAHMNKRQSNINHTTRPSKTNEKGNNHYHFQKNQKPNLINGKNVQYPKILSRSGNVNRRREIGNQKTEKDSENHTLLGKRSLPIPPNRSPPNKK